MDRIMWHLRPALFFAAIAVLAFAGCTTAPPVQTGTEFVHFTLHKLDRAQIKALCPKPPPGHKTLACEMAGHIYMPLRHGEAESVTRHTFVMHSYVKAPCNSACVIDGQVHTDVADSGLWRGTRLARFGDAVIEVTGAPVGYNDAEILGHELRHVLGFSHR